MISMGLHHLVSHQNLKFATDTGAVHQAWRLLLRLKVIALDMKSTDSQSLRQNLAEHTVVLRINWATNKVSSG